MPVCPSYADSFYHWYGYKKNIRKFDFILGILIGTSDCCWKTYYEEKATCSVWLSGQCPCSMQQFFGAFFNLHRVAQPLLPQASYDVHVQLMDGEVVYLKECQSTDTILTIKSRVEIHAGLPVFRQMIFCTCCSNENELAEELRDEQIIHALYASNSKTSREMVRQKKVDLVLLLRPVPTPQEAEQFLVAWVTLHREAHGTVSEEENTRICTLLQQVIQCVLSEASSGTAYTNSMASVVCKHMLPLVHGLNCRVMSLFLQLVVAIGHNDQRSPDFDEFMLLMVSTFMQCSQMHRRAGCECTCGGKPGLAGKRSRTDASGQQSESCLQELAALSFRAAFLVLRPEYFYDYFAQPIRMYCKEHNQAVLRGQGAPCNGSDTGAAGAATAAGGGVAGYGISYSTTLLKVIKLCVEEASATAATTRSSVSEDQWLDWPDLNVEAGMVDVTATNARTCSACSACSAYSSDGTRRVGSFVVLCCKLEPLLLRRKKNPLPFPPATTASASVAGTLESSGDEDEKCSSSNGKSGETEVVWEEWSDIEDWDGL
jgi:hypothetical protein